MEEKSSPHFFTRPPEGFGGKISFILTNTIDELRRRDAKSEVGIFRVNGNSTQINAISAAMDNGIFKDWAQYDSFTISCVLKKHLRDTVDTDALFPPTLFDTLKPLVDNKNDEDFIRALDGVSDKMSRPRYFTIVCLFQYLREVADMSDVNKMGSQGISICMAPNLFPAQQGQSSNANDFITINAIQNKIVQRLVDVGHFVFSNVTIPEEMFIEESDIQKLLVPIMDLKEANSFLEWRSIRRVSKIPYIPVELSSIPGFVRPTDPIKL